MAKTEKKDEKSKNVAVNKNTKKSSSTKTNSAAKTTHETSVKKDKKPSNPPICLTTGRRKKAVAKVFLRKGNGVIAVNNRPVEEYFTVLTALKTSRSAFDLIPTTGMFFADVRVKGGGYTAQATAVNLGIARALVKFDETLKPALKKEGFLTVDARVKERKKYGQKGARAKFQFTKR